MDINSLLKTFLGGQADPNQTQSTNSGFDMSSLAEKAKGLAQQATQGGVNSFAGGAVAGGLLSLLLSNGKARDIAGGALGYGGAALLGALAHKAYQNYQSVKQTGDGLVNGHIESELNQPSLHTAKRAGDQSFGIVLIKGMIAAAKSDGHLDSQEQERIFSQIEKMNLPSDQKELIFDALMKPIDLNALTNDIQSMEQATEFYLASCLAIDPNHPEEQQYLQSLATTLKLPSELVNQIHEQLNTFGSNR
jgi:uncharacterized membrane protein YebE (DUF533 family)